MTIAGLGNLKIFADSADLQTIIGLAGHPKVHGFTTNPTLMRRSGVRDYKEFAHELLEHITDRPVCFEVLADGQGEMVRQARIIASWGSNVYIKIPAIDTRGASTAPVLSELASSGVRLNVTALTTLSQVKIVTESLAGGPSSVISVFAGRIADTGRDPVPVMRAALDIVASHPEIELLWASAREILNARQASDIGVHIITLIPDLLDKLSSFGRPLDEVSLETVRMFHADGLAAGYSV